MTLREALAEGTEGLLGGPSDSPFLDASLLLAAAAGVSRDALLARLPDEAAPTALSAYRTALARRAAGEPIAYILGYKEFYGRNFLVDRRVLVPRPDTELLVEAALDALPTPGDPAWSARAPRAHDAFAGSGCVGISLAAERPGLELSLSDASEDALELCAANAAALLGRALPASLGDVLSAARGPLDLITANPPYVKSAFVDGMEAAGCVEPRLALDGGPDGLALYGRLAAEALGLLAPGGTLLAEIGEEQGEAVAEAFMAAGFVQVRVLKDLAGLDRVVGGRAP